MLFIPRELFTNVVIFKLIIVILSLTHRLDGLNVLAEISMAVTCLRVIRRRGSFSPIILAETSTVSFLFSVLFGYLILK